MQRPDESAGQGMTRRLFMLARLLSLLLAVAVIILWVRSYWVNYYCLIGFPRCDLSLYNAEGSMGVGFVRETMVVTPSYRLTFGRSWPQDSVLTWRLGGIGFSRDCDSFGCGYAFELPCWCALLLTLLLPLRDFQSRRRRRRLR